MKVLLSVLLLISVTACTSVKLNNRGAKVIIKPPKPPSGVIVNSNVVSSKQLTNVKVASLYL